MKTKKWLTMLLVLAMTLGLCACGGGSAGKPVNDKTTIQFWGWGDDIEAEVFQEITDRFNTTVGAEKGIVVKYVQKAASSYSSNTALALSGNNTPDVIYVEDSMIKAWANAGYLAQLDSGEFTGFDFANENGDMWDSGIMRYRFDPETATTSESAPLWALPKDIGPTVLFYNSTYLKELQVTEISIPEEELEAYNAANGTSYTAKGFDLENRVFNNRIAMNWEQTIQLAKELQKVDGCDYGYYNEWWFNYGWSIGGNCVQYMQDEGYYKFTLNDPTKNYIVKDDVASVTINGNTYNAGELISYTDKSHVTDADKASLNELPSMYDAFLEFVALTAKEGTVVGTGTDGKEKLGYGVSMGANSLGTAQSRDYFISGKFGMFVSGRWDVPAIRRNMSDSDKWGAGSWNVAPLPVYKEFDSNGSVTVHGVPAGHSGSMGLAIAEGSRNREAAFEFLKFVAGEEGQTAQAEAGFAIPNQKAIASQDVFLQPDKDPANAIVFVEAAEVQEPGDWWALTDGTWIDDWANFLNYTVRENKATVDDLFEKYYDDTQEKLNKYTGYTNG